MTRVAGIDFSARPLVAIPVLMLGLLLLAFLVGHVINRLARGWFRGGAGAGGAAATGGAAVGTAAVGEYDPTETPALGVPIGMAVLFAGVLLLVPGFMAPGRYEGWLRTAATVLLVASCAIAGSRLTVSGVTAYAARRPSLAPALSVARMSARIVVGILAVLTGLQALGVPVTPLLTTLGIGSLAVALALQDTLANFFAGLYLLADRPVRPGDYVKLIEGAEGYVDAIGWRSSRLRTPGGNTVIVPNQKLSQSILTNFHLPRADLALVVPVTVPYEADADRVEASLSEVLKQAARDVPEIVPRDPAVRLVEFGASGLVFHCVVQVRDFESQGRAAHELRKRVLARMKTEGVDLPYPQQVVHEAPARDDRGPRPGAPTNRPAGAT